MNLLRQAIIFDAALPSAEQLAQHLAELPHQKITPVEIIRCGFVTHHITNELVSVIPGGYAFQLRVDEKILPSASVKAVAAERIAEVEQRLGHQISSKERNEFLDQTRLDLAKTALVKTSTIQAFFHSATNCLIIATASKAIAQVLVGRLVQLIGSLKTATLPIGDLKNGLTTRLDAHLSGHSEALEGEGFTLSGKVKLSRSGETVAFKRTELSESADAIRDLITAGFRVDQIGLSHNDLSFDLGSDFSFKSITDASEVESEENEDPVHHWRTSAAVAVSSLTAASQALCKMLEQKPEDDGSF